MKARMNIGTALCMFLIAVPALVHPRLVKARPPADAALEKGLARIQLWFDEELEIRGSGFTVLDRSNQRVDAGTGKVNPENRMMEGPRKPLSPGIYAVKWEAVADDDKGAAEGSVTFRVRN